ncbi:hypothetical protein [Halomonas binhaiensis]|uniref:Type 4 fimbrial biogenesis protein PilX N-terminal domain-containing protein n=1 Tax=Halomonas binhaiensis TaxID=2562282 RepID=A0A5C1NFT9_9GAMM|nr:hypothetical protein [Halomonas binhaiensis]QEM80559.1 hypothetical protein E4T21_02550 [Halomonas binhaiensis]
MSPRQAQTGASLLMVLMLLLATSMAALSAMTSALVNQHLATNMHALTQANMAAEWGGSVLIDSELIGRELADSTPASEDQYLDCEALSLQPTSSLLASSSLGSSSPRSSSRRGEASHTWSPDIAIAPNGAVSYRYASCRYQGYKALMVMGSVRNGDTILARHFLIIRHAADGQYMWRDG